MFHLMKALELHNEISAVLKPTPVDMEAATMNPTRFLQVFDQIKNTPA